MASGGPIFVIGAPGSGSGLLRLGLDLHERLAIAPETGFMRAATAHRFIPFWAMGGRWHRRLGLSDEERDEQLRGFYDGLFGAYAQRAGKARWGEATPWHLWHAEAIAELFPDAVFAAMVRHPAASALSIHRRLELDFDAAVRAYAEATTEILRQAARLGDRCALVRHEELVLRPEGTLEALVGWLGEAWPGGVRVPDGALDPERASRWTRWVGDWRRQRVESGAAQLAAALGYDLAEPHPAEAWERGLLLGSEVAARGLELPAPRGPLADRPLNPRDVVLRAAPPPPATTAPPLPPRRAALRRATRPVARRLPRRVRRGLRAALRRGA